MATIRMQVTLKLYDDIIRFLSDKSKTEYDVILNEIKSDAYIANDELTDDDNLTVKFKIDATHMSMLLSYVMSKNISEQQDYMSDTQELVDVYHDRIEKHREEQKKREEYNTWLNNCFDKYVVDNETPTCKELMILINNNELKQGMEPIKYQNIMRQLKTYRVKRFGR